MEQEKMINPEGLTRLCQAIIASSIREQDEEFANGDMLGFYLCHSFSGNGGISINDYRRMFREYKKRRERINSSELNISHIKEMLKTMSVREIAEHYDRTENSIRSFLYRKGVSLVGY